jgi:hypothetical protein
LLAKPFFPVVAMGLKLLRKMSKLGNRGNGVFVGPGRWILTPSPWAALMVRVGAPHDPSPRVQYYCIQYYATV